MNKHVIGCQTLLNVLLPPDTRSEHERRYTHSPIDTYRFYPHDLPLLGGATRIYWHENRYWYEVANIPYPLLTSYGTEHEPYALAAGSLYKLAVYLAADTLPYQVYNTIHQMLQSGRKQVWLVKDYSSGTSFQYLLFRLTISKALTPSFVTFLPDEQDTEKFTNGVPIKHDITVTLYHNPLGIL